MTTEEKKGHFVQGRFVIDAEPEPQIEMNEESQPAPEMKDEPQSEQPTIEHLIQQTSKNVELTVESVVVLGKKLFMTQEGRDHIEAKIRKVGLELQKAIGEIAEAAKNAVERK
jgi:hypothetical protein